MSATKNWIKPPDSFSFEPEKWDIWKSRFKRYLNVSGQLEISDTEKIDLMIYLMGEQAEIIYNDFKEKPTEFESVVKAFDHFFNPRKTIVSSRTMFHRRVQREDEPIDDFINDLMNIANECDFGDGKDDLIRDRILVGMRDVILSTQLQDMENLTLEQTISYVKVPREQNYDVEALKCEIEDIKVEEAFPSGDYEVTSSNCDSSQDSDGMEDPSTSNNVQWNGESTAPKELADQVITNHVIVPEKEDNTATNKNGETSQILPGIVPGNEPDEVEGNISSMESICNQTLPHSYILKKEVDSATDAQKETFPTIPGNIAIKDEGNSVTNKDKPLRRSTSGNRDGNSPTTPKTPANKRQKTGEAAKRRSERQRLTSGTYSNNVLVTGKSIKDISDELLLHIFEYLNLRERIKIERVCKRWQKISLKSWEKKQKIDIKNDFKNIKDIHPEHLSQILRRSGKYITHLNCNGLDENPCLKQNGSLEVIHKYCKKLTHLDISYTWDTNNYLGALNVNLLHNLKSLHVGGTKTFCDKDLTFVLEKAVNLEEFFVAGYAYKGNVLKNLSENCKTLSVQNSTKFSDVMLQDVLTKCKKIENLDISGTQLSPESLFPVRNQLKALGLSEMKVFFKFSDCLDKLKCANLRMLDLNFNVTQVNGKILSTLINNCPEIEELRLRKVKGLKGEDFMELLKLKKLKYLDVSNTEIKNEHLISLANSVSLKKLVCYWCRGINENGLKEVICTSPELEYLSASMGKLSKGFINLILPSLQNRKNGRLTISLKTISQPMIHTKKVQFQKGVDTSDKPIALRLVNGCYDCSCSFEKSCTCFDHEETVLYFG